MYADHRRSAEAMAAQLARAPIDRAAFRAALEAVAPLDRDAWIDVVLGLDAPPDDVDLPRGCVPYLPCPAGALLHVADAAEVTPADVVVDLGAGVGRAAAVLHLLTGAAVVGVEIQPALVDASRALMARLRIPYDAIVGDAAHTVPDGTVYFLYCPFDAERVGRVLDHLEARPFRLACVDLPAPPRPWLAHLSSPSPSVSIYADRGRDGATREWRNW